MYGSALTHNNQIEYKYESTQSEKKMSTKRNDCNIGFVIIYGRLAKKMCVFAREGGRERIAGILKM